MDQTSETSSYTHENSVVPKAQHSPHMAPRWVAAVGALAFGILYAALPEHITLGPSWLPLVLEVIILLPFLIAAIRHRPLSHTTIRTLAFVLLAVITLALVIGVIFLIISLPNRADSQGPGLLRTGALLWISNILVFALWYWEIDGGGPLKRHQANHQAGDFLFPQQADGNKSGWAPHFLDYVFVAFTGATALSPTDTYPLTRTAKGLMMLEALIALIVLAILIGRAVNIL